MKACVLGKLKEQPIKWKQDTFAMAILMASEGYPGSFEKGNLISGKLYFLLILSYFLSLLFKNLFW